MKFLETNFIDYIKQCENNNLHKELVPTIKNITTKNINNMIMGYRNILPPENINFLLNKIIDTFM